MGLILQKYTKTNMREVRDRSQKIVQNPVYLKNCLNNFGEYLNSKNIDRSQKSTFSPHVIPLNNTSDNTTSCL